MAQRLVLAAPQRALSLASIMSSSGARYLPGPKPQVWRAMTRRPAGTSEDALVPTLVVHGTDDPMVPFPCGQDTARRIPGARLVPVPGMDHDLPRGVVERLLQALRPRLRQSARP